MRLNDPPGLRQGLVSPQAVVAMKQAELMQKHGGWCLLRPVRADQSEQTGFLGRGLLKRQALKWSVWAEGETFCVFSTLKHVHISNRQPK